jgi:hypothetical protein
MKALKRLFRCVVWALTRIKMQRQIHRPLAIWMGTLLPRLTRYKPILLILRAEKFCVVLRAPNQAAGVWYVRTPIVRFDRQQQ